MQVKAVSLGEDATTMHLVISLDTSQTGSMLMAFIENPTLQWGEWQMLHMREFAENPNLQLANRQRLEGDLVFPGGDPGGCGQCRSGLQPGQCRH